MVNRPLIIPFRTESYVTNNQNTPDKMCARISPDYAQVEYSSYLGGKMEPSPFTVHPPLSAGVHLHFILPECFRRAVQKWSEQEKDYIWDYANVPDRWVVTRIRIGNGHKIFHKSFVIESNYVGLDNCGSVAIPYLDDPNISHRFLGRTYEYGKEEKGSGNYLDTLTVMGAGDPYFAAYYPDCYSVFGFHDDMSDVETGCEITYFISGYFAKKEKNPLYHVTQEDFASRIQELGLEVREENFFSDDCVLFSEVCNIRWDGYRASYPDARPTGEIRCGMGNTSAEVISALIARSSGAGKEDGRERLLNALQYEMADTLYDIDGISRTEDVIHAQTFSSVEGGNIWKLDYDDTVLDALPENTGFLLAVLNEKSRLYERKKDEIAYWRDNAYAAWYSYMLQYEGKEAACSEKEKMKKEIFRICDEVIPSLEDELAQLKKEMEDAFSVMKKAIAGSGIEMTQVPDAVFFEPKEPVMMLYGDGVKRSRDFDADENLLCQAVPVISLSDGTHTLQKADIMRYIEEIPEIIPFFADYFIQSVCLNEEMVKMIGEAEKIPNLSCDKSGISHLAYSAFEQSWQTFMMEWRIAFYPSRTLSRSEDDSMKYWEFDGLDYDGRNAYRGEKLVYSGRNVITPHSLYRFQYTARKYMEEGGMAEEEIERALKEVENLPLLSQSLDGLGSQLLSRIRAVQAPVIGNVGDEKLTQIVQKVIPAEKVAVNDVLPCFPLRAGHLFVEKVNLLNTFGLIQNVSAQDIAPVYSEVFGKYKDLSQNREYGLLRPRILGPARLCFDFVCADNEQIVAEPVPDTSPLCGMILPELLNSRLALYSAEGRYYGALKTVYRGKKRLAKWISPPGQVQIPFEEVVFEDEDFKNMIRSLLQDAEKGGNAYTDLLMLIKQQFERVLPSGLSAGTELSYIWGRPLAVFKCRAALERKGGLACSQLQQDYAKYDTLAVEKIGFPIMAGDMSRARSGIIGYFENRDYSKLYPAYHAGEFLSDYIRFGETISLCINAAPKILTMISEIGNPLYFQTGILPVSKYDLPAVHTRFVSEIRMCFEADSVICIPDEPALPTPPVSSDTAWYFAYVDNEQGKDSNREEKILCTENVFQDEKNIICDGYLTLVKNEQGRKE